MNGNGSYPTAAEPQGQEMGLPGMQSGIQPPQAAPPNSPSQPGQNPFEAPINAPLIPDSEELYKAITTKKRKAIELALTEEDEERLKGIIDNDIQTGISHQTEFRRNHLEFIRNWRGIPEEKKDHPLGKLAANVKVPFTSTMIEQWKARFSKLILGPDRVAKFVSLNPSLHEDLSDTTDWFDYELREIVKIDAAADAIFHYLLIDGIATPIPYYEVITEPSYSVREFELSQDAIGVQIEQAIQMLYKDEAILKINQDSPGKFVVEFERARDATITVILDDVENTLVFEIEQDKVVFDGVRVRVPSLDDVIVRNSHPDIDKIPSFTLRFWESVDVIKTKLGVKGGYKKLSKEDLELLEGTSGMKEPEIAPLTQTREQDKLEGTNSTDFDAAYRDDDRGWIEIYRTELNFTTKSGKMYPLIVWMTARHKIILKIEKLEGFSINGKRTAVKFDFISVPDRFYSVGMAEWLRHVQVQLDAVANFRLDSALISTVPYGFYTPAVGFDFEAVPLLPGKMYPVRDIKGIYFPNIQWNSIWGFQEEALIRKNGSELAGVGDPGSGTFASKRVSASEFQGTSAAIDIRTEFIARGVLRAFRELLTRIFMLYQRYAKTGRVYQVVGPGGESVVKTLDISKLHGKMQVVLSNNIQVLSNQLERETSMMMISTLMNPVLVQMGVVKPDSIYQAVKKMAKAYNYEDIPLHTPDMPEDSPPPLDEHQAMQVGKSVEPHLGENFNWHLKVHLTEMQDPDFEKKWPSPMSRQLLEMHVQSTLAAQQQAMLMKQQQAMMAAQMQQKMASNGMNPAGQGAQGGSREEGVTSGPAEATQNA